MLGLRFLCLGFRIKVRVWGACRVGRVGVCMYVCMHVCMCVHVYLYVHVYLDVHECVHAYMDVHECVHVHRSGLFPVQLSPPNRTEALRTAAGEGRDGGDWVRVRGRFKVRVRVSVSVRVREGRDGGD